MIFGDDILKKLLMKILICTIIFYSQMTFNAVAVNYGDRAEIHLEKFSRIGSRSVATQSEKISREYIENTLSEMGYKVKNLKFKVEDYDTYNIEVNKKGKDTSKTIIIGAHYDGRIEGNACDDNGSGISVLLELCEVLKDIESPYNLKFIFFGAEEINVLGRGLHGSYDYVESLSKREKNKIKYMINLDTLVSGDKMYAYNCYKNEEMNDESKELLMKLREVSQVNNINLNFNFNDDENVSFTNTKSDYYPFFEIGVPVIYFESTNWEAGDKDGRSQTESLGRIIHTPSDNLILIESLYENRIKERLRDYVNLVKEFVLSYV